MKVHYTTENKRMHFEFDAQDTKSAFESRAKIEEIFETGPCGECGTDNHRFIVREVDGNKYYEVQCRKCFNKLGFGQNKVGQTLFPRRRDNKTGEVIGKQGWHKWSPDEDDSDDVPQKSTKKK